MTFNFKVCSEHFLIENLEHELRAVSSSRVDFVLARNEARAQTEKEYKRALVDQFEKRIYQNMMN